MGVRRSGDNYAGDGKANVINGNGRPNAIDGGGGNDSITGGRGDDLLGGNRGHDTIYGGAGNDIIDGGRGNDLIVGGAGNDILVGGRGQDILTGGRGQDVFAFESKLGPANVDVITDFNAKDDTILLSHAIFGKIAGLGDLAKNAFVTGPQALDKHDRIVYDPTTGALSYDPDGSGAKAAVQFAQLNPNTKLTHKDFLIL
ncbi:calcium-binding protein [Microvirga pudoricolor]|uniref:calcium-binding protein n=1 Tax=Microvirga pudoricolor TaxID=2778729 RepID=UPI00194E3972|nr:calcium-binding protein [Microvirga pudoricolor]MBM6593791.1 hypothetical protein [Microvirga pudoricolor]